MAEEIHRGEGNIRLFLLEVLTFQLAEKKMGSECET